MANRIVMLCGLMLVLASNALSQGKVYLPFFEVLNMNEDYQYSISKLFKSYTASYGAYEIVLPDFRPNGKYYESMEETKANAAKYGAEFFMKADLNRIGETVIVSMALYKTETGEQLWSASNKALNPDDLDKVINKLAGAINTKAEAGKSGEIYNVSEYEAKAPTRVKSHRNFGGSINGGLYRSSFNPGFGLIYSVDAQELIYDIRLDLYPTGSNSGVNFSLGVIRPLTTNNHTAFLVGNVGYGSFSSKVTNGYGYTDKASGTGIIASAGVGYILNRSHSASVRISSELFTSTFNVGNEGMVTGLALKTTILFE